MILLKLNKKDRELYVLNNPTSYMLAIEYGWTWTQVSVANDTILNNQTDIN
jgi:hypothetical protein